MRRLRTLWTVHVAGGMLWGLAVANHLIFLRQTVGSGKSQHDRLLVMDARTHRIVRTLNVPLLGAAGVIAAGHVYLSGIVRPTGTRLIALAPGHRNLRSMVGPKLSQVSVLSFPARDNTNWQPPRSTTSTVPGLPGARMAPPLPAMQLMEMKGHRAAGAFHRFDTYILCGQKVAIDQTFPNENPHAYGPWSLTATTALCGCTPTPPGAS